MGVPERALAYFILFVIFGRGIDVDGIWPALLLAVLQHRRPLEELNWCSGLALCFGLLYIMDWNVWYQKFPLPTVVGAVVGKLIDVGFRRH